MESSEHDQGQYGGDGVLPDQETWNQHQEGDWQNLLEATQTQIWGLFDVDKKGQQKIVNIFEDNSSSTDQVPHTYWISVVSSGVFRQLCYYTDITEAFYT